MSTLCTIRTLNVTTWTTTNSYNMESQTTKVAFLLTKDETERSISFDHCQRGSGVRERVNGSFMYVYFSVFWVTELALKVATDKRSEGFKSS
ncbi:hypothetical protein RUM44_006599 [Polyplax serrata]|uniref:Uncharacterized protein n=1 Tax=Polyplax serrata TaxID=468196 RepID=A0ABR1AIL3_POLSC